MKTHHSLWFLLLFGLIGRISHAQNLYAGVWRQGNDGHYLWSNVSWDNFKSKWEELSKQNLRLEDLMITTTGNQTRFSGVWRQGSDGHYLWVGVDWANFENKWKELGRQNLRLIDLEIYQEGGKTKYAGVWREGRDGYYLWAGVDWTNFENKWKELGRQNLRLIDLEIYQEGGKTKYAGVWREGRDGYYLWAGVDWTNFENKWKELGRQNLRLVDLEIYQEGGKTKYAGVWREGRDGYYLWSGVDWENFTAKWNELAKQNLRLVDLEVYPAACKNCLNQVVMPTGTYNYGITRTATHCPGLPGTCGAPGASDKVWYRWPVDVEGTNRYARLSALYNKAQFLYLPFNDQSVTRVGIWRYGNGNYHHAGDYWKDSGNKTFPVLASTAGRVIHIGWDNWSGNTIVLSHDVNGVKDAYRTIYMHLRNGAANDCDMAWSRTMKDGNINSTDKNDYKTHLTSTGCAEKSGDRKLNADHWGTTDQTINQSLLGKEVKVGQTLAWAGNTGPGGKRGSGGPNTHLHIFWAYRDPGNNEWYFFDPYGIYATPDCYPAGITDAVTGPCVRYPVAWRNGRPQYAPTN